MSKIYTKKGDQMQTSLFDGTRVKKSDDLIELVGLIDTMMAQLCVALNVASSKENRQSGDVILVHLRNLMGELVGGPTYINQEHVYWLESLIDDMDTKLEPLNHFINFQTSCSGASMNVFRTSVRTAERHFSRMSLKQELIGKYLNRLSDVAFTMARIEMEVNHEKTNCCNK